MPDLALLISLVGCIAAGMIGMVFPVRAATGLGQGPVAGFRRTFFRTPCFAKHTVSGVQSTRGGAHRPVCRAEGGCAQGWLGCVIPCDILEEWAIPFNLKREGA